MYIKKYSNDVLAQFKYYYGHWTKSIFLLRAIRANNLKYTSFPFVFNVLSIGFPAYKRNDVIHGEIIKRSVLNNSINVPARHCINLMSLNKFPPEFGDLTHYFAACYMSLHGTDAVVSYYYKHSAACG